MKRFYTDQIIQNNKIQLNGKNYHYIKNVLRMNSGDKLILFNGTGYEYEGCISLISNEHIEITINNKFFNNNESKLELTLCLSILKDKKMDIIIRQSTELGVKNIIPFHSERSVPKPSKNQIQKKIERWKSITIEAAKQCRRSIIPNIYDYLSFTDLVNLDKQFDLKIIFWENAVESITKNNLKNIKNIIVFIGPEGGFSEKEINIAKKNNFFISKIGPRILKSETAAISACSLIQYIFGDMN